MNMSDIEKKVRALLTKYYQGNTSIEEEEFLVWYFHSHNTPTDLLVDKEVFVPQVSKELEGEMEQMVSNAIAGEYFSAHDRKPKIIKLITAWAAAASVIIILGLTWAISNRTTQNVLVDTFDDPYEAMMETKRVLALLGTSINKAQEEMQSLQKIQLAAHMMEPVQDLSKNLNHLEKLNAINKPKELPYLKHFFDTQNNNKNKPY